MKGLSFIHDETNENNFLSKFNSSLNSRISKEQRLHKKKLENQQTEIYFPTFMKFFKNIQIIHLSCSYSHAIAISSKGLAFSWGKNNDYQLGLGFSSKFIYSPSIIENPFKKRIFIMSICGKNFSALLNSEGLLIYFFHIFYFDININFYLKKNSNSIFFNLF